jgi:hypothetical protein
MNLNLSKPWKYKDFLIWPNTSFDKMEYNRIGCSATIDGVCLKNLSIQECVDKSTNGFGYYIKFENGNSICVPLKSEYKDENYVYKLTSQYIHPELNNTDVSTFLSTKKYNFPPKNSNQIFYYDILQIENIETSLLMNVKYEENSNVEFKSSNDNTNIMFIPNSFNPSSVLKFESIKYGSEINIIIPGTNLILVKDTFSPYFIWKTISPYNNNFIFKIVPLDNNGIYNYEKLGKSISYGDMFTIIYSDNYIVTLGKNRNNNLLLALPESINELLDRNDRTIRNTFKAISKMQMYYCKDNKCVEYDNKNIDKNDTLYRNSNCLGICSYSNKNILNDLKQPSFNNNYIIIIILLIILIIIYIYYHFV